MIRFEFYYDRDTGEEIKLQDFDDLVAIHGIDKVSDWIEVVTIPNDTAQNQLENV
jgi:hypothetical protein